MNVLEMVNWEYISFQELDSLLRISSCSEEPVIDALLINSATPLCMACRHNREDLVSVLLHHGAKVDKCAFYQKQPLHFACDHSRGNTGMVRKLLMAKADVDALDSDSQTGLHLACTEDNVPVVELLLEHGANVNQQDIDGESPLVRACLARSSKLVDILLKAGSDPNVSDGQPLEIVVRNTSIEILKLLMEAGASINKGAYLSHASECNHIEMMKCLHSYGADVNKVNILGMSPLQTACLSQEASPKAVHLLLEWGADVHACSHMMETALHCACEIQDIDKIRLLLAYGADPDAQDFHRLSPLLVALKNLSRFSTGKDLEITRTIVRLLLATGARLKQDSWEILRPTVMLMPSAIAKQNFVELLDFHVSQPASLQCLCRISIRKSLPSNIDECVDALPLPRQVVRFLRFNDIIETHLNYSSEAR